MRLCLSQDLSAQTLRGAQRDRICVRIFIGVSEHARCERPHLNYVSLKKMPTTMHGLEYHRMPNFARHMWPPTKISLVSSFTEGDLDDNMLIW